MARPLPPLRSRAWWRGRTGALTALAIVCAASLAARAAWLGQPCHVPCRSANDHVLVFDEDYYVNAARVIAGVTPPATAPYAQAPLGDDPNAEHPQLAKLMMAGLIEVLGDGPLAWRLPSIIFGTVCLLGMYALTRSAGGGRWLAVGATALMAADTLLLVHSRIGTLDIFAAAGMVWGVAAYLRARPALAGLAIGLGACAKLVAPYALVSLVILEGFEWARRRTDLGPRLRRLAGSAVVTAVVLLGGLAVMGQIAPPYDNAVGKRVGGGPFGHLAHMFTYASQQTSPRGPTGIASYPWQWLIDLKPITYLNINPSRPAPGLFHVRPVAHFVGVINPPILLAGLAGLLVAAIMVGRCIGAAWGLGVGAVGGDTVEGLDRDPARGPAGGPIAGGPPLRPDIPVVSLAWFLGTYLPFVALSVFDARTSYLYYMLIVMPGLYLAAAALAAQLRGRHPRLVAAWIAAVAVAAVLLYPFVPLP